MRRADIENLAKAVEEMGYEILSVKALTWHYDKTRKTMSGAYSLKIAPAKDCEENRAMRK